MNMKVEPVLQVLNKMQVSTVAPAAGLFVQRVSFLFEGEMLLYFCI